MARNDPTIYMRIPQELKDKLDAASIENRRSLTAEVVARLEATFDETVVTTVEARAKPGAEEKYFVFNADEVAEKVAERLSGKLTMTQPISLDVLKEKYLRAGETSAEDLFRRIYRALSIVDGDPSAQSNEVQFQKLDNTPHGPKQSANAKKRLPRSPKA